MRRLWSGVASIMAGASLAVAQEPEQRVHVTVGGAGESYGAAIAVLPGATYAVGAPRAVDAAGERVGRVELRGAAFGQLLWSVEGADAFARFGADLAPAGAEELWVGAPGGEGRVHRVESAGIAETIPAPETHARFGQALATLDDLDGDGDRELAVGAPGAATGGVLAGWVGVRRSSDGAWVWTASGEPFDQAGASLAAVGDLDGDDVDELAIGLPFADGSGFNRGAVELRSGRTGALLWRRLGLQDGERLAERLVAVGDIDGDGAAELWAGAPGLHGVGFDSGGARLISGVSGALLAVHPGLQAGEFAAEVAGLGDVDGDGVAELVFGSPSGAGERGRVQVLSGAALLEPAADAVLVDIAGAEDQGWFGAALRDVGDLNGDGRPELAVGAPGHEDQPDLTGRVELLSIAAQSLWSQQHSLGPGATQWIEGEFEGQGGDGYFVVGSMSGTAPGLPFAGHHLPLVVDAYTAVCLTVDTPLLGAIGTLDPGGRLLCELQVPAMIPSAPGFGVHHACLVHDATYGTLDAISNAVPLWIETGGQLP